MTKVLVIDDNAQVAEIARQALAAAKFEVSVLTTAFQALSVIRKEKPDLVLLDVTMPALSGDAIVPLVKNDAELKGVRVVFYSALATDELRELALRTSADGFIEKTVRPSELVRRVREWLNTPK